MAQHNIFATFSVWMPMEGSYPSQSQPSARVPCSNLRGLSYLSTGQWTLPYQYDLIRCYAIRYDMNAGPPVYNTHGLGAAGQKGGPWSLPVSK